MRGHGVVAVACAAQFLVVLDASIVNVALPDIQRDLGFSPLGLQWVVNAYAVVFAGLLLLGGRLADLVGVRAALLAAVIVFGAASAFGAAATSPAALVGARAVQALGAAVLVPASLTLLTTTFAEGPARTRALAAWAAVASAGGAAGSLAGGILTDTFDWRATLWINVPVCLAAGLAVHRRVTPTPPTRPPHLDVVGALTVTLSVVALTYALSAAPDRGWSDPVVVGGLGTATTGLAVFVAVETKWSARPLLPLRLVRIPAIGLGNVAMLLAGACLMPMWFLLSLVMQQGLGMDPLLTGLGFLPHTLVTVLVGARFAPWLLDRFPARAVLAAGCLTGAAGFAWQAAVVSPHGSYLGVIVGPAVLMSTGGGLLNTPLTALVTSGAGPDDAGAASGLLNTSKQVGGALGLAVALAVASAATSGRFAADTQGLTDGAAAAFVVMAGLLVVVAAVGATVPAHRQARR